MEEGLAPLLNTLILKEGLLKKSQREAKPLFNEILNPNS